jgi:hypothetical protein
MKLKTLFFVILVALLTASCQTSPEKGVVTRINSRTTLEKFWAQKDCSFPDEGLLLEKQGARIISKFRVRNFEFSVRIKSSRGEIGRASCRERV